MRDIRTGELDISIGTGTADIQGFEAGEVSASAGTGSISLQGSVNSDLDLECGIGTIEFQDSGKMTDYNYSVSCGMGSIQIGDDEFTKPAGKQNDQQSCWKRNGYRVWYGNRQYCICERRVRIWNRKDYIVQEKTEYCVECAEESRNISTWIRF